jgi:hypothetical protein
MKRYEPLAPPIYSGEEARLPAPPEEEGGFRIEISRTHDRLVAHIPDRATLNYLSRQLMQGQGVRFLSSQSVHPPEPAERIIATKPLPIIVALLVGALFGMLVLPALRYIGTRSSPPAADVQEIDLPSEEPAPKASRTRFPDPPAKRAAEDLAQHRGAKKNVGAALPGMTDVGRAEADPVPAPTEGPTSTRTALHKAFESDEVQTWAEGRASGFVLAGPARQSGDLTCRTMVHWKRGDEQGEARNVDLCKDNNGRWVE